MRRNKEEADVCRVVWFAAARDPERGAGERSTVRGVGLEEGAEYLNGCRRGVHTKRDVEEPSGVTALRLSGGHKGTGQEKNDAGVGASAVSAWDTLFHVVPRLLTLAAENVVTTVRYGAIGAASQLRSDLAGALRPFLHFSEVHDYHAE